MMKTLSPNRLEVRLSDESMQRLERLRGLSDAASNAEVVRTALKIYEHHILGMNVPLKQKDS